MRKMNEKVNKLLFFRSAIWSKKFS
jgi:hypothetical protein